MPRDYLSVETFPRQGVLVCHGDADRFNRPDAIEFQARSGQRVIDWAGEVHVWIDRWPTRDGMALLFERAWATWVPAARSLAFDAIYVTREQEVKLAFGVYVDLTPAASYRLQLPGAVLTRPTLRIGALQRDPAFGKQQRARQPLAQPEPVAPAPFALTAPTGRLRRRA